ncbi:putative K domain, type 1 protein [Helianthus anomalus]
MDTHTRFPNNQRPFDPSTVDRSDPYLTPSSSTKRGHQHHHHHPLPSSPATPQSTINNPFRNPIKLSSNAIVFRILCTASKSSGLIGKGGAIICQFKEKTDARIRINETIPSADESVVGGESSDWICAWER